MVLGSEFKVGGLESELCLEEAWQSCLGAQVAIESPKLAELEDQVDERGLDAVADKCDHPGMAELTPEGHFLADILHGLGGQLVAVKPLPKRARTRERGSRGKSMRPWMGRGSQEGQVVGGARGAAFSQHKGLP